MIDLKLIAKLRATTGAGILDCRKALEASNNDFDAAIKWLRENGISKATKKADRDINEGLIYGEVNHLGAAIIEIKCETDFVARNEKLIDLARQIANLVIKNKIASLENLLAAQYNEHNVKDAVLHLSSIFGERLEITRLFYIPIPEKTKFSSYRHTNNKIMTVIIAEGAIDDEILHDISMHVTALAPQFIDREAVSQDYLEREQEIIRNAIALDQAKTDKPKPDNIVEKMIVGRLNKQLMESCLSEQIFIKDGSIRVKELLLKNNGKILTMLRVELGK